MDDFHSQGYVDYLDAIESRNMSTDEETFGRGAMGGDRLSVARSHHTPRVCPALPFHLPLSPFRR